MPSIEDVRRTVRALVGVIQQAALGSSPVAEGQVCDIPLRLQIHREAARPRNVERLFAHQIALNFLASQVAHVRKVVRLLSLSHEQVYQSSRAARMRRSHYSASTCSTNSQTLS